MNAGLMGVSQSSNVYDFKIYKQTKALVVALVSASKIIIFLLTEMI